MPTSPPNGHGAHLHIWQHGRLMVPHCTPQPDIYRPFWCPPHSGEGVSYGQGWLPPKLGRQPRRRSSVPIHFSQLQEQRVWVWLLQTPDMVAVGTWWHLLGRGGADDTEECNIAPLRSLYKPSASNPATARCTFCSSSTSNCCASSLSKLAHLSICRPWKKGKRFCHKGQA